MKRLRILGLALSAIVTGTPVCAEEPPVPTTHLLAIGYLNPDADRAKARAILPTEVRETVKLYLSGKIEQWFFIQDRVGVVFLLNETNPTTAHQMLETLPLGQAHLMTFQLIPVGPLKPLNELLGPPKAQ